MMTDIKVNKHKAVNDGRRWDMDVDMRDYWWDIKTLKNIVTMRTHQGAMKIGLTGEAGGE